MSAFERRVQSTISKHSLFPRGSALLVAVSGGPDSMCLLSLLVKLSPKYDWTIRAAHVNYRLRGADSDRDEQIVRNWAEQHNIPVSVKRVRTHNKSSSEAALRTLRYDFLESVRKQHHYDAIAVAHTEDDQAETVLLRLIRGAGTKGLGAMQPKNGFVVRPLLFESRKAVLTYLSENHTLFGEDTSNFSPKFTRNRVRHELIPLLESRFNPHIRKRLAQTATLLTDDETLLNECSQAIFPKVSVVNDEISFATKDFLMLPPAGARRFLRQVTMKKSGSRMAPNYDTIEEMQRLIRSTKNKIQKKAFQGLNIEKKGDRVRVIFHKKS